MIAERETHISNGSVVVVDDEPMVREVVTRYLRRDGFKVSTAADGLEALDVIHSRAPDLVVLDLMLPILSGLEVLKEIRTQSDMPVILLTARGDEADRVLGLELGADDYVTKPFSARELSARVRTVLRRAASSTLPSTTPASYGELAIDPAARVVRVADEKVDLTRREFELLAFMAQSPGQVFTRAQLLDHVWGSSPEWQDPSTVTVHIRRLRTKLGNRQTGAPWITTVWGVGYRFDP